MNVPHRAEAEKFLGVPDKITRSHLHAVEKPTAVLTFRHQTAERGEPITAELRQPLALPRLEEQPPLGIVRHRGQHALDATELCARLALFLQPVGVHPPWRSVVRLVADGSQKCVVADHAAPLCSGSDVGLAFQGSKCSAAQPRSYGTVMAGKELAMSKTRVTVFICTDKDCAKAWRRLCDGSPGRWLKRQVEAAGLPYKLTIVKTECMDNCEHAGCLCFQRGQHAAPECDIPSSHDADRLLAALRSCVESAEYSMFPRISHDAGRR